MIFYFYFSKKIRRHFMCIIVDDFSFHVHHRWWFTWNVKTFFLEKYSKFHLLQILLDERLFFLESKIWHIMQIVSLGQFAWIVRSYFLGKIRKISSVCCLLRSAHSMVSVNCIQAIYNSFNNYHYGLIQQTTNWYFFLFFPENRL